MSAISNSNVLVYGESSRSCSSLTALLNFLNLLNQTLFKGKKVKASHTRYRALVPELIPVYIQSARRCLQVIHLAVGCHYFPPGLHAVTFPAAEHHRPLAGTKLCCLMTDANKCEQLAQDCYAAFVPSRI